MVDQIAQDLDMEDLRRLHAIYNAMACGVVTTDAAGAIIDANDAAQQIFGLGLGELRGRTLPAAHRGAVRLDGSPIALDERPFSVVARTGHALRHQVFGITRLDGRRRWLQVETVPMRDADGQVRYIVSSLADITERIEAEDALRASEERFRMLSEHASDLVRVVQGDGTFLYVSPSHRRILGYEPVDLLAHSSFDFVHPDDLPRMLADFNTAIERGDTVITSTYRVRHADGAWRVLEVIATDHQADPVLRGLVINARDVTERVAAQEALRQSEERFRTLIEQAPLGVGITDERGVVETVNDALCSLFGYTREELIGRHIALLFPTRRRAEKAGRSGRDAARWGTGRREVEAITRGGEMLTVLATTVSMTGADGRPKLAHFVVDITERKRTELHLDHLAHHDTLTGLPNRVLFHARLSRALDDARKHGQLVGLFFLDLDGFKAINDTLGHDVGDLLLRAIAHQLRRSVRERDTVARLGGDEFTLLLPDMGSGDNAAMVARKILDELIAPVTIAGHSLHVTASIGISLYPFDGYDADALVRSADMAMYRAKGLGKNTFAFFGDQS